MTIETLATVATIGFFLFLGWLAYLDVVRARDRAAEREEKEKNRG